MGADGYLQQLLVRYRAPTGLTGPGERVRSGLYPLISRWAGPQLSELKLSGSYAKDTAVRGATDVDLFVGLRSDTTGTLRQLYESLALYLERSGYSVRRQNVSLGIVYQGLKVDITPGRRQDAWGSDHSLYVRRLDTWRQTNVDTHVRVIGRSGYTPIMVLLKRWRDCHGLAFLSFAVELAVLRSLQSPWGLGLADQTARSLTFLRDNITTCQLIDPANSNNDVAGELTRDERLAIASRARQSLLASNWGEVIW
ncbi:hypothetical protein [Geodermatophilus sp. SYSU D01119]